MTSISTAMSARPPDPPLGSATTSLDQLRQAALLSKRKKMQAAEAAAAAQAASSSASTSAVPISDTNTSTSSSQPASKPTAESKKDDSDREEGEISEEDEPPPPPKAPRLEAAPRGGKRPPPRGRRPWPPPRTYGSRPTKDDDYPAVLPTAPRELRSAGPPSAPSTISASPTTPTFASMQSRPPAPAAPQSPAEFVWPTDLDATRDALRHLTAKGYTADSAPRNGYVHETKAAPFPPSEASTSRPRTTSIGESSYVPPRKIPTGPRASASGRPPPPIPTTFLPYDEVPTAPRQPPIRPANPPPPPRINTGTPPVASYRFEELDASGIPGLQFLPSLQPPPPVVISTTTTVPETAAETERRRALALASRRLKAELDAARKAAAEQAASTPPAASESSTPVTPSADPQFYNDLEALLAETENATALKTEEAPEPQAPSPAPSNYTYDTDLADEREIENAVFALDDDDVDMDEEERPVPKPAASSGSDMDLDETFTGELRDAPQLSAAPSVLESTTTTSGEMTPLSAVESEPPFRPNGRPVVTDLDAQPVSRPEKAPVLSRPVTTYRRSYHHRRQEEFKPLVIDISDSEDEQSEEEAPAKSKSPSAPSASTSAPPTSTKANDEVEAARLAAQRRLAEIEAEKAKYARIMARLEEKARKAALAQSAAGSRPSTPLDSVATSDVPSRASPPAVSSHPEPESAVSSNAPKQVQPAGADVDIKMEEEKSKPANHQVKTEDISVTVDAPTKEVHDGVRGHRVTESVEESTTSQIDVAGGGQVNERTYRFFKPYVSIFDEYPLLRSHAPTSFRRTNIQAAQPIPASDTLQYWPVKKAAISAASNLNPSARLCQFESSGGRCRDDACPDTHAKDWNFSDSVLASHLLSLYPTTSQQQLEQTISKVRLEHPYLPLAETARLTLAALHLA